ncbi:MAG: methyltransferase family protein [Vicinamibacteria bacterium]
MNNLELCSAPLAFLWLSIVGMVAAVPALVRGWRRRGTGARHEKRFAVQHAPRLAVGLNLSILMVSFEVVEMMLGTGEPAFGKEIFQQWRVYLPILTVSFLIPDAFACLISWCGLALAASGLLFLVGGWYSLGESFSADAEILDGHALREKGLFRFVMHPVYSGIFQYFLAGSIVALSPASAAITFCLVVPLYVQRAKYEEKILIDHFGERYLLFAKERRWRRFIPSFLPLGF